LGSQIRKKKIMSQNDDGWGCAVPVVLIGLFVIAMMSCGMKADKVNKSLSFHNRPVEAKVLVINKRVLDGELIGGFLSGTSGKITETNIVGVSFKEGGKHFLIDLEVSSAKLAYYKDQNTLPLKVTYTKHNDRIKAYLMEERVYNGYFGY
jgi:hypothetical protein